MSYVKKILEGWHNQGFKSASDVVLEKAVKGMLPKNSLGKDMFAKLKTYKNAEHPHQAQKPRTITVKGVK